MELYIRILGGKPFEHPIFADNFREAFPHVDVNNLPAEFARFVRVQAPRLGPYEKNQTVTYKMIDGVYTDVYHCEQMTVEEILEKQNQAKTEWTQNGFASWIFNEATCWFDPPTLYPNDGKNYRWDEPTTSWVEHV
jgi:hypothetical protein